jgi:hypothetical protein
LQNSNQKSSGPFRKIREGLFHSDPRRFISTQKNRTPSGGSRKGFKEKSGIVLLSRTVAGTVPSAQRGLTALFGMGRGVTPAALIPEKSNLAKSDHFFCSRVRTLLMHLFDGESESLCNQ